MKNKLRKLILVIILVAAIAGGLTMLIRHFYNPYSKEGLLLDVMGIEIDSIDSMAVIYMAKNTRAAETEDEILKLVTMLNTDVTFEQRFDRRKYTGGPLWIAYFFLETGERIDIGISEDKVRFYDGNMCYVYQGEFDLSVLETIPRVENSTKYWYLKDKEYPDK